MSAPACPSDMGKAGRALWRDVVSTWEVSAADVALLTQACRVADHLADLHQLTRGGDVLIVGRLGQVLPNPLFAEIRSERRLLLALLGGLGFTSDAPDAESGSRVSRSPRTP